MAVPDENLLRPSASPGRALGLDVGSKTIGLAISDPLGLFASPVETLKRSGRAADVRAVLAVARTRGATTLVVGLPQRTDGTEGPSAVESRRMAAALLEAEPSLAVEFVDERFTTVSAERALRESGVKGTRRRAVVDQVAAHFILQQWLDSRPRSRG